MQQCTPDDTQGAEELRRNRTRAYVFSPQQDSCTLLGHWVSYLFINNVTWNDAGEYSCEASSLSKNDSVIKQQITLEIGKLFIKAIRHA